MAQRPVFIPGSNKKSLVEIRSVDFEWHAGMAPSRKKLNVKSLHSATHDLFPHMRILEVSRFSETDLGIKLSAFNLLYDHPLFGSKVPVECIFQSSKVFENGGPFKDLLNVSPRDAKRDSRLQGSGRLKRFLFLDEYWELLPQTAFYDFLYLNALVQNNDLTDEIMSYDAFTDIAFNPKKSINCQAGAVALYASLRKNGRLSNSINSKEAFISEITGSKSLEGNSGIQGELF